MNKLVFELKYAGNLAEPKTSFLDKCGVYFWVFGKEIIYVGTTQDSFKSRISTHQNLFKEGNRTMWFPNQEETVYDLMNSFPINKPDNHFYKEKVYIPDEGYRWYPNSDLRKKESFDLGNIVDSYMKSLKLYLIPITNVVDSKYENYILCLESFIQLSLYREYKLFLAYDGAKISTKTYLGDQKFDVLGKQEKSSNEIVHTFQEVDNIILDGIEMRDIKGKDLFLEGPDNSYYNLRMF